MDHSIRTAGFLAMIIFVAGALCPTTLPAQHEAMHDTHRAQSPSDDSLMMMTPLGVSMDRMGSGTTWVPDAAPIPSVYTRAGSWDLTAHGFVFGQYNHQGGRRGDSQFGSQNWGMFMANHWLGRGMIQLRTMLSLDALGVTPRGYPLLLQSGEEFEGEPLHDRQHPHDFFMELSALYLQPISRTLGIELYAAPSGEPALGPVAFMHRPSAMDNQFAPIGHHWQDATHISFGVLTAGLFGHDWKLEASVFNGREPDDHRWDFDLGPLSSYSARLTVNPDRHWSVEAGAGRLRMTDDTMDRVTGSVLYGAKVGPQGQFAATAAYGANHDRSMGQWTHSGLLEAELVLNDRQTVFGRAELVQKDAADLALVDSAAGFDAMRIFRVGAVSLGAVREVTRWDGVTLGLGLRGTINFVPTELVPFYGSRHPIGATIFLRLRPVIAGDAMARGRMPGTGGMP